MRCVKVTTNQYFKILEKGQNKMNPSDFTKHPYNSVLGKSEAETIARNIMIILKRTGDEFRLLSWNEYKSERLKDGGFTERERSYFDQVVGFCVSEHSAKAFCSTWNK